MRASCLALLVCCALEAWADGGNEPTLRGSAQTTPPLSKPQWLRGRATAQVPPRPVGEHHVLVDAVQQRAPAEVVTRRPGVFPVRLLDTRDGSVVELGVPLDALVAQHPQQVKQRPGPDGGFWWALLRFEPEAQRAAMLFDTNPFDATSSLAIAWWSLETERFSSPMRVDVPEAEDSLTSFALARDGSLDLVLKRQLDPSGERPGVIVTLRRLDLSKGTSTRVEHALPHPAHHASSPRVVFDPGLTWVALAVQIDQGEVGQYPVRFVELATGAFFDVPALPHTYAVAFDVPRGMAWLASASTGVVQRVSLKTKKVERERRGFGRVHSLVPSPDGKRLLVLPSTHSFYAVDPATLAVQSTTRWALWLGVEHVLPFEDRVVSHGQWLLLTNVAVPAADAPKWAAMLEWQAPRATRR